MQAPPPPTSWRRFLASVRRGAAAPLTALSRTARDGRMVRVQLAFAAVMVASWCAIVSLSVLAYAEGGSRAVAAAVLARAVPGAVLGPLVGALVDRVARRNAMVLGAGLAGLALAGAALSTGSLVLTVVLVALAALAVMLFRMAQSAVLPELVEDPTELTAANVLSSAVEAMGVFGGPALAGLLLLLRGPDLALGAAALLLLGASLVLLGLPVTRARAVHVDPGAATEHRTSELLRLPAARVLLLLVLAQTVLNGGLTVLYPALAVDALDAGLSAVGVLTSAFGLGGVLASLALFGLAGSRRLGGWSAVGLALWSVPLLVLPLWPELVPVLVLLLLVGGGNTLFDVTSATLLQRGVPGPLLGRAFGALETVVVLGLGAGAVLGPVLDSLLGAAGAVAVLASLLAVVGLLAVPGLRRLDRSLEAPTVQVALLRALPVFALLPPLQVERLALQLRRVTAAPGEQVVRQFEQGSTWFLVESGLLEVDVDGRTIGVEGPGEAFGEVALLHDGVRTATVTAREPSLLWSLEGEVFLAALRADGRALAALDETAARHLRRAAPAPRPEPRERG